MIITISQEHRLWAQRGAEDAPHLHIQMRREAQVTDEPNVTHTAAGAAESTCLRFALFCFLVHKALAPPLAHLLLQQPCVVKQGYYP